VENKEKLSIRRLRQEDHGAQEVEASLCNTVKPHLKINKGINEK
jgi:hypothetical protein